MKAKPIEFQQDKFSRIIQPFPQSYYTFKRQATTDFQRKTRNKLVIVERKEKEK